MNGTWVKKTVLCFWMIFYSQALHFGILPVQFEAMRPRPAWRACGSSLFWIICMVVNAALVTCMSARTPDTTNMFVGIFVFSILLFALISWQTVNARRPMCDTIRALITYCERHPLSPSSWRLLFVAAVLTSAFSIFHLAWVVDTYADYGLYLRHRCFWQASAA
ncbi:uncharacterized protein LOC113207440 isoform X2 [Frankliniella occidentalis]|uniref:Uncharacterized protein LOC113207440 isoform X2 n=1 Tax=Frankliniella occidentalis TaxID=133901 RepID=A0A9C6X4T8_FRAOC|nr:uncharacterized protein LOC113207440 isoform X2 [Frankliniella occidentalis]